MDIRIGSAGIALVVCGVAAPCLAQAPALGATDRVAVFKAAGAVQRGGQWVICADDPHGGMAELGEVRDLDGDGRLEAIVIGHGTFCYGSAESGFVLLGKQASGGWKVLDSNNGIPEFLETKGKGGWPDLSVGGPGFCFPVMRWNGTAYALHRFEYEGKTCKPDR